MMDESTMFSGSSPAVAASRADRPFFPGLEILEEIAPGVGGMGVVYKAREAALDRIVAVKTLRADRDSPQVREFFLREAPAAAKLEHANILRIHGFSPEHAPPFFVMQYVDARPLDQACAGRDFTFVARVLEKIARALAYAHGRGIIHRDIKPSNILVDRDDEPHVADFGLAGRVDQLAPPAGGSTVGTPVCIAPEIYLDPSRISVAADVYALGVTMYRLITGRYPFVEKDQAALREAVLEGHLPMPQDLAPAVPEPLGRICLKAMERDPAARYESAGQMADDLERFLSGEGVYARPTRYDTELRGNLQNHLTNLRLWHEQNLIDARDFDRLSRPAQAILAAPYPWHQLSRRFPWETILLRLGGWLVVIASVLWVAFYWKQLSRGERVAALVMPTISLSGVGWLLRFTGSRVNSIVFLSIGAMLLPLCASVVLSEMRWFENRQVEERELFAPWRAEDSYAEPPPRDESNDHFRPSNLQSTVSVGVFVAYCLLLLAATRSPLMAIWVGIGCYLLYAGILLITGLKCWMLHEHVARALVAMGLFSLVFWPLALRLNRRPRLRPFAATALAFFPLPLATCLTLLGWFGGVEWFDARKDWEDQTINLWWMIDGVVYLCTGLWAYRARNGFVRFWGPPLILLATIHLSTPVNLLWEHGWRLMTIGGVRVTSYELAALAISLVLAVLGTRLRVHTLAIPGLVSLAVFVVRATDRHFAHDLSWPLSLVIFGGSAMTGAAGVLIWRLREKRESPL